MQCGKKQNKATGDSLNLDSKLQDEKFLNASFS